MNFRKKAVALASVTAITATSLSLTSVVDTDNSVINENLTVSAVDDNNDDWLHAVGSHLYDMEGNEVWLTGANWFGFNCIEYAPHYLYAGDIDDMLSEVADRGINVIRFPISTELILSWMNGTPYQVSAGGVQASYNPPVDTVDESGNVTKAGTYGHINKDFVEADGKTLITSDKAFDVVLNKCKQYGIKAFIDIHSPHADNSGHNYNLWYGKETADGTTVTTDIWIETLTWLAEKYSNNDTLIGYDLKNEPHGKGYEGDKAAKWDDSTDENNWAYAATKCAESILEVNPNALIFIEGVEQSLSGAMPGDYWGIADRRDNSPYIGAWWGGNLRGVRENPIVPKQGTSQIVYSPHDYGPSVYAQTWFNKDFTTQTLLDDYWYDTWAYINAEDIAPELIGEWGGHMDGAENQKWMELLRDYMIDNHINHTFWCLNTNSGDTGGLWAGFSYSIDSGTTITWEEEKYALFEEALWQTSKTGKYIGLDHQKALGNNGTGISVSEYYASYADSEGSNLDASGEKHPLNSSSIPQPPVTTTASTTTEEKPTETTVTTTEKQPDVTTASETSENLQPTETSVASSFQGGVEASLLGDITNDGQIDVRDVTFLAQVIVKMKTLDEIQAANADVNKDGNIDVKDISQLKKFLINELKSF
ncbi:MAG: cellulase family glycosylhydrolase [Oscillospiraceae bacterium]